MNNLIIPNYAPDFERSLQRDRSKTVTFFIEFRLIGQNKDLVCRRSIRYALCMKKRFFVQPAEVSIRVVREYVAAKLNMYVERVGNGFSVSLNRQGYLPRNYFSFT